MCISCRNLITPLVKLGGLTDVTRSSAIVDATILGGLLQGTAHELGHLQNLVHPFSGGNAAFTVVPYVHSDRLMDYVVTSDPILIRDEWQTVSDAR